MCIELFLFNLHEKETVIKRRPTWETTTQTSRLERNKTNYKQLHKRADGTKSNAIEVSII